MHWIGLRFFYNITAVNFNIKKLRRILVNKKTFYAKKCEVAFLNHPLRGLIWVTYALYLYSFESV